MTITLSKFAKTNERIEGWKLVSRVEPEKSATPPSGDPDSNGKQPNTSEKPELLKRR